jgi:hypothetical protein
MAEISGRILLAAHFDARVAVAGLHDLVRDELDLLQDLVVAPTHEPLDREDGVLGIRDRLPLGHLTDQDLAVLAEPHDGGGETAPFLVGDDRGIATLHHRDHRVRRPEVDADHLRHVCPSFFLVVECAAGNPPPRASSCVRRCRP